VSSAFLICRRSPVLARRSALVRPGKLQAARSAAAARFRRGSGSGSDHGGPVVPRPGTRADLGWAMRPGPALPRTGYRFRRCPCSMSRLAGACADDQYQGRRCLGRRCGGSRMSPARGELPCVDEHLITIDAPRARCGARCGAIRPRPRASGGSPIARLLGTQPRAGFEVWTARQPIA
jgi:hypothetical protein